MLFNFTPALLFAGLVAAAPSANVRRASAEVVNCDIVASHTPGNHGGSEFWINNDIKGALSRTTIDLQTWDPEGTGEFPWEGPPGGAIMTHTLRADGKLDLEWRTVFMMEVPMILIKERFEEQAGKQLDGYNFAKVVIHEIKCELAVVEW